MFDEPLFSLIRDGYEEVRIRGEIAVWGSKHSVFRTGEGSGNYPARSLLKPFQFLAAQLPELQWKGQTRYVACLGSVSATEAQVKELEKWHAEKSRWEDVKLIPGFPMDERHRAQLKRSGQRPEKVFHTCFSKHMAILEACEKYGWSKQDYLSTDHPYHKRLIEVLSELLGENIKGVKTVTDGCQLPSPVLSMEHHCRLFQRLAGADRHTPLGQIQQMMLSEPQWIGGPKRVDTSLMEANPGLLIAKEGADGLLAIGVLPNETHPEGLGVVVKLCSGYQPQYNAIAIAPLLKALGLSAVTNVPPGHEVRYHYVPLHRNKKSFLDISPLVEESTAVFPGDCHYNRNVSLDMQQGDHLTLSSVNTTTHIGAHADAPNHFKKGAQGIDGVDLFRYQGPCQVIEIRKAPNTSIEPRDIRNVALQAARILFKTGSFPDTQQFNTNFVSLHPTLIRHLAEKGVVLVGIDTPSIDPSESKTLDAHRATLESKMAILEGLVLSNVKAGFYRLSALPLRLGSADASPVRAVLTPTF